MPTWNKNDDEALKTKNEAASYSTHKTKPTFKIPSLSIASPLQRKQQECTSHQIPITHNKKETQKISNFRDVSCLEEKKLLYENDAQLSSASPKANRVSLTDIKKRLHSTAKKTRPSSTVSAQDIFTPQKLSSNAEQSSLKKIVQRITTNNVLRSVKKAHKISIQEDNLLNISTVCSPINEVPISMHSTERKKRNEINYLDTEHTEKSLCSAFDNVSLDSSNIKAKITVKEEAKFDTSRITKEHFVQEKHRMNENKISIVKFLQEEYDHVFQMLGIYENSYQQLEEEKERMKIEYENQLKDQQKEILFLREKIESFKKQNDNENQEFGFIHNTKNDYYQSTEEEIISTPEKKIEPKPGSAIKSLFEFPPLPKPTEMDKSSLKQCDYSSPTSSLGSCIDQTVSSTGKITPVRRSLRHRQSNISSMSQSPFMEELELCAIEDEGNNAEERDELSDGSKENKANHGKSPQFSQESRRSSHLKDRNSLPTN